MSIQEERKRRGRPPTFRRSTIVSQAMDCYWCEGLNDLSINELCRQINISKPTLYREFGGEDGLLVSVLEHYNNEVLTPIALSFEGEEPLNQKIDALIEQFTDPTQTSYGCLLVKLRLNPQRLGPSTQAILQKTRASIHMQYLKLVVSAQEKGVLRADIEPDLAARFIDNQLTSILIHMNAGESPELVRAEGQLAMSILFDQTYKAPRKNADD
jgi:TetR/AcrR family transcriptional regulator, copper-responsive repressor